MGTNRIYELNLTATRFWELLDEGHSRDEIERRISDEFDVVETYLSAKIDNLLASLRKEQLIDRLGQA